jgi:Fe-S-cluster formation regulator IscX/YfhJ
MAMRNKKFTKFYLFELTLDLDCTVKNNKEDVLEKYANTEELQNLKSPVSFIKRIFENKPEIKHSTPTLSRELIEHCSSNKDSNITSYEALIKYKDFNSKICDLENMNDERREMNQADDEAPLLMSHIVFKFVKDSRTNEDRVFVALEQSTGIYITAVIALFQKFMKKVGNQIIINGCDEIDKNKKMVFFSKVDYKSSASKELEEIIKDGQLQRVKVVTSTCVSDDNESSVFRETSSSTNLLEFNKKPNICTDTIANVISKIHSMVTRDQTESPKTLYITMKDQYVSTDKFDIDENTSTEDIKNIFCHKPEFLHFESGVIEPSYKNIKTEVVNKLLSEIMNDEKLKALM